jgi:HAD superfamily hydrolase (TIGR01490 family)
VSVALFDMDRTLVRKNTAQLYVRWQRRNGEASIVDSLRVAWWIAQYTVGVVDAENIAVRVLSTLAGKDEKLTASRCEEWFHSDVIHHVGDRARNVVKDHLERGDVCAIVTGAWRYTAEPLARTLAIPHVIATELERDDQGRFTGKHVQPLCYGHGKIARSEALAKAHGFDLRDAIFYSDSISDLPLLERVGTPVAVNPDPRLARIARARGWRVERW